MRLSPDVVGATSYILILRYSFVHDFPLLTCYAKILELGKQVVIQIWSNAISHLNVIIWLGLFLVNRSHIVLVNGAGHFFLHTSPGPLRGSELEKSDCKSYGKMNIQELVILIFIIKK